MNKKRILRWASILTLAILAAAFIAYRFYIASLPKRFRAAESKAHEFCEAIAIGSDISTAVAKAKAEGVSLVNADGYSFYFPATPFDMAVCEVSVSKEGKVVSRKSEMEYD